MSEKSRGEDDLKGSTFESGKVEERGRVVLDFVLLLVLVLYLPLLSL